MKTCDTCKWWGNKEWSKDINDDKRRVCCHPKVLDSEMCDDASDGCSLHKSIDTSFCTGPKFGCVHHERKIKTALVVAKYEEDASWIAAVKDFDCFVYDKGNGGLPNIGREAHTYLHHIVTHYDQLEGEIIFCQGRPTDHDPLFLEHIRDESIRTYGAILMSGPDGEPHADWCPVAAYCKTFNLPVLAEYPFVTGAQFRVTAAQILLHPKVFYEGLLAVASLTGPAAWTLERMWLLIFGIGPCAP